MLFLALYTQQVGALPQDCDNITETLTRHAAMLVAAGIDFVVADSTNIQSTGKAADALQLRPFEVMLEEWSALRAKGIPTPKVAIWQNLQVLVLAANHHFIVHLLWLLCMHVESHAYSSIHSAC